MQNFCQTEFVLFVWIFLCVKTPTKINSGKLFIDCRLIIPDALGLGEKSNGSLKENATDYVL